MKSVQIGEATLYLGDSRDILPTLEGIDATVTDPPYGLSFMGKRWDYDVPDEEIWAACLAAMKPGAHLLAFAGTRTQHRMAVRIEDAGFEIRDMIAWVYGSGFPKSLDVSKAIDKAAGAEREVVGERKLTGTARKSVSHRGHGAGATNAADPRQYVETFANITAPATDAAHEWQGWGTALKPALEPITVARKPLSGTVAANVQEHGTGALNIDGCRVQSSDGASTARKPSLVRNTSAPFGKGAAMGGNGSELGRWPANFIHDGSDDVVALFPYGAKPKPARTGKRGGSNAMHMSRDANDNEFQTADGYWPADNGGSAARFFYKASEDDIEWLDRNLNLGPVSIAAGCFNLQNESVASALCRAVIAALPGGKLSSVCKAPSTSATPRELRLLAESVIGMIPSIAQRFLLGSERSDITMSNGPVKVAAQRQPTGTMTITASHWKSDGSAAPVTFSITPASEVAGERDFARFSYCAKASKKDRDAGLDGMDAYSPAQRTGRREGSAGLAGRPELRGQTANPFSNGGGSPARNTHPTVKPTDLMRYLCRLVTPPGGVVLDPFMGSGSTGKAAMLEGFRFIGIERDPHYFEIACRRIEDIQRQRMIA